MKCRAHFSGALFARSLKDIEPGDAVRVLGHRGVCFVREVNGETAVVVWSKDLRDIVPLLALRRVKPVGSHLDIRN